VASEGKIGWDQFDVSTVSGAASAGVQAFAAGFLEGTLTADVIAQTARNTVAYFASSGVAGAEFPSANVTAFLLDQAHWAREQVAAAGIALEDCSPPTASTSAGAATSSDGTRWSAVCVVLRQLDGLQKGYGAASNASFATGSALLDVLTLNAVGDLFQIMPAVDPSARVDWQRLAKDNPLEAMAQLRRREHCSGLVRVTDDYSELYFAHSSFFTFGNMLRIYKHYDVPADGSGARRRLSFSSYPGYLESLDDFYVADSNLAMVQTSNNVLNASMLELVTPHSLLAWQRVRVSMALAQSGQAWCDTMRFHASGTYANQYMVVDLNKFTPHHPLEDGTLWVCEEAPGLLPAADMTPQLARGYWPSYNRPYFDSVWSQSGYGEMERRMGANFSYALAPRAKIFRREAPRVANLEGMKRIMRLNVPGDPYSEGKFSNAICARGDLDEPAELGGCYDSKISSATMARRLTSVAINGPTAQGVPAFQWSKLSQAEQDSCAHEGQPDRFDFDWMVMQPTPLVRAAM
jgi:hypothetical protein